MKYGEQSRLMVSRMHFGVAGAGMIWGLSCWRPASLVESVAAPWPSRVEADRPGGWPACLVGAAYSRSSAVSYPL